MSPPPPPSLKSCWCHEPVFVFVFSSIFRVSDNTQMLFSCYVNTSWALLLLLLLQAADVIFMYLYVYFQVIIECPMIHRCHPIVKRPHIELCSVSKLASVIFMYLLLYLYWYFQVFTERQMIHRCYSIVMQLCCCHIQIPINVPAVKIVTESHLWHHHWEISASADSFLIEFCRMPLTVFVVHNVPCKCHL